MSGRHFRGICLVLGALVCLIGCGSGGRPGPQDFSLRELQVAGLAFSLTPNGTTFPAGQPITLTLNATNNSTQPLTVRLGTTSPAAFPPLRFEVAQPSGFAVFLGDVLEVGPTTIAPGAKVALANFVWNQTNTAGQPVAPGNFALRALIGEVFVNGQSISNPFGTIYIIGPAFKITAAAGG